MHEYEQAVQEIVEAVYDNARAFSLRDRDDNPEEIEDQPPIVRMRLSCRAAENLLLTDEVLTKAGTTWSSAISAMDVWLEKNVDHSRAVRMGEFKSSGYERKSFDLKELRILLTDVVLDSNKPWEVIVGATIAGLLGKTVVTPPSAGSMHDFLGEKVIASLL